jgi:hypothetical protein
MWSYKADKLLRILLRRRLFLREFLLNISWQYAHYQGHDFHTLYGWRPERKSFWFVVKYAWYDRKDNDY